jgi:hypothetical protein
MSEKIALGTLLSRMTRELRRVENRLSNLENVIGDILLDSQSPRSPRFHELQEIDRARQEIAGIADFLDHLADSALPDCAVDLRLASRSLGLADLAAALVHGEVIEADFGEFEHFA